MQLDRVSKMMHQNPSKGMEKKKGISANKQAYICHGSGRAEGGG